MDWLKIGKASLEGAFLGAGASLLFATNSWTGALLLSKAAIISCAGMGAVSGGVSAAFGPTIDEIVRESSKQIVENTKAALSNANSAKEPQKPKEIEQQLTVQQIIDKFAQMLQPSHPIKTEHQAA